MTDLKFPQRNFKLYILYLLSVQYHSNDGFHIFSVVVAVLVPPTHTNPSFCPFEYCISCIHTSCVVLTQSSKKMYTFQSQACKFHLTFPNVWDHLHTKIHQNILLKSINYYPIRMSLKVNLNVIPCNGNPINIQIIYCEEQC